MNTNAGKVILEQVLEKYRRLLKILEIEGDESVSFGKSQLRLDIKNIEQALAENYSLTEYDEMLLLLKENYNRMYPIRGGLTDFYVWRDNFDERMKANQPLSMVKDELNIIFANVS